MNICWNYFNGDFWATFVVEYFFYLSLLHFGLFLVKIGRYFAFQFWQHCFSLCLRLLKVANTVCRSLKRCTDRSGLRYLRLIVVLLFNSSLTESMLGNTGWSAKTPNLKRLGLRVVTWSLSKRTSWNWGRTSWTTHSGKG